MHGPSTCDTPLLTLLRVGKNRKPSISLHKAGNDDMDALAPSTLKKFPKSLRGCLAITVSIAACNVKAFSDTELWKSYCTWMAGTGF